jgi:hypothetical protein
MNGFRPAKKLTAKELQKRNDYLELVNAKLTLDIRNRTIALLDNLWTYESVIDQLSEQAGTISEFRRWFQDFKDALNRVPMDAVNHKELLREELAKIDIHLADAPDHGAMIDHLWERDDAN